MISNSIAKGTTLATAWKTLEWKETLCLKMSCGILKFVSRALHASCSAHNHVCKLRSESATFAVSRVNLYSSRYLQVPFCHAVVVSSIGLQTSLSSATVRTDRDHLHTQCTRHSLKYQPRKSNLDHWSYENTSFFVVEKALVFYNLFHRLDKTYLKHIDFNWYVAGQAKRSIDENCQ